MRLRYPNLVQIPSQGTLDNSGIDLVERDSEVEIDLAVQCKGFDVINLETIQIGQVRKSLSKFRASKLIVREFMVVYNLDGRFRNFVKRVDKNLQSLIKAEKCESIKLIGLDQLFEIVREPLREHLETTLVESARNKLRAF